MVYTTDLTGLFDVQKQYATGLVPDPLQPDAVARQVTTLNTGLNAIQGSLQSSNGSSATILTQQTAMNDIVTNELDRLNSKKTKIDSALVGQKRAVSLNDSYRQRYVQYINIIITIVIALVLIIGLSLLSNAFEVIPSFVVNILIIIIVVITMYICYVIMSNIKSRDKIDYNKLDLAPPKVATASELVKIEEQQAKAGNLLGGINLMGCIGDKCCSTGTYWDQDNSVCKPGTNPNPNQVSSFTTMSISYNSGQAISPNSPNEYANYARI